MDLYTLNSDYQAVGNVIDRWESFIWTERYSEAGEFSFVVEPTIGLRATLYRGRLLSHSETEGLGIIDEVLVSKNEEGARVLTVSGKTFESVLDIRSISTHVYGGGSLTWNMTGTVGEAITLMVSKTCVTGTGHTPNDIIPGLYVVDNSGTTESVNVAMKPQSLYSAVKELADSEDLGFKVRIINGLPPSLAFTIYKGVLRPNVVFSSTLDNIAQESLLDSQTDYRNVAYVFGKDGDAMQTVAAPGTSVDIAGLARRVMEVDATDIDPAEAPSYIEYLQQLQRRGLEALATRKKKLLFDGELTAVNPFKYNVDYFLGDIITKSDENGVKALSRVTEYIWAYTQEGYKSYPTFTAL